MVPLLIAVQLLHKLKIRASDGPDVLLKVIKNPVTQHFPAGAVKIGTLSRFLRSCILQLFTWGFLRGCCCAIAGTSVQGDLVDMKEFVPTLPEKPIVSSNAIGCEPCCVLGSAGAPVCTVALLPAWWLDPYG